MGMSEYIPQKRWLQLHTCFRITESHGNLKPQVSFLIDRAAGISQLGLELSRSHALIFLQEPTVRSQRLADQLNLDLGYVYLAGTHVKPFDFKTVFYDALEWGNIPRLEDFLFLRPRLYELQREMIEWRPQKVGDLLRRRYKDPLTWYGFWFATVIGSIGILSLGVSVTSLIKQFK